MRTVRHTPGQPPGTHTMSLLHRRSTRARPHPVSRGQSLVEFALVAPIMLLLVGAALDLGRIYYSQITITNASREAALMAAKDTDVLLRG